MIDSVTLLWEGELSSFPSLAETAHIENDSGEYWLGKLGKMKVKVTNDSVWLSGSLPKYLLGNNLATLRRKDIITAIEKLSGDLNFNIGEAQVLRLDVSTNFIMSQPIPTYLDELESYGKYRKVREAKHSLRFESRAKSLIFYDKAKEMKSELPLEFIGKNILRYELQFKRQVSKIFGKQLKFIDLANDEIYKELIKIYYLSFVRIKKKSHLRFKIEELERMGNLTPKKIDELLAVMAIDMLGIEQVSTLIDSGKNAFANERAFFRAKSRVRELSHSSNFTEQSELASELEDKIKRLTYNSR
jgi:hypothetical protein